MYAESPPCIPWTKATPIREVRWGSSPYVSLPRPHRGSLKMLMLGPKQLRALYWHQSTSQIPFSWPQVVKSTARVMLIDRHMNVFRECRHAHHLAAALLNGTHTRPLLCIEACILGRAAVIICDLTDCQVSAQYWCPRCRLIICEHP